MPPSSSVCGDTQRVSAHVAARASLDASITCRGMSVNNGASAGQLARRAVDRWQAVAAGTRARRFFRVHTIAPGAIAVRIQGDADVLARAGFAAQSGGVAGVPRRLAWIALDPARFAGSVTRSDDLMDVHAAPRARDGVTCVRLNGGYFNYRMRASAMAPEHVAIGPQRSGGGRPLPSLPVPEAFADDFREIAFADGSSISSAPMLSESGRATFADHAAGHDRYRLPAGFDFDNGDQIAPGMLWHAADPNPRAAISVPSAPGDARVRLVAAPMNDRNHPGTGWRLTEFSHVTARIDRMERPANTSLNLDGGESVALMAWTDGVPCLQVSQTPVPRRVANLIEFTDALALRHGGT